MSDDKFYKDGDVVWVKLGNNWWPGEVTGIHRHPDGLLKHLKRKPYCVVKFFQEDSYEYVKSSKQIFPFNCNKKDDFIKKGLALYNAKNKFMEKFPGDVEIAERLTKTVVESDVLIINDRPDSIVKAILGQTLIRATSDYYAHDGVNSSTNTRRSGDSITKILNITPNRTNETTTSNAIFSGSGSNVSTSNSATPTTVSSAVPAYNSSSAYRCNLCDFTSLRQNVMIFHRKTHSATSSNVNSLSANKDIKERSTPSSTETKNKPSNENLLSTPLTSKAVEIDLPSVAMHPSETAPTQLFKKSRKERKTLTTSPSLTFTHMPSSAETIMQMKSPPKGTKKKNNTTTSDHTKRKSLRSAPTELINLIDESTTITPSDVTKINSKSTVEKDYKTKFTETVAANVEGPKRNSEDIIRSWQAEWSDEEESTTTSVPTTTKTIDEKTLPIIIRLKATMPEKPMHSTIEHAVKPQDSSPVVNVCTPPVVNRIRNIPKKDRRDIILKEFSHELSTSNSQSSISVTPPTVVTIVDSGSSSNSNSSSESVVLVEETPIASAVVEVIDVIDDDVEVTKISRSVSVSEEVVEHPASESETEQLAVAPTSAMPIWSCFDFQEEEENESDVLTSISKFKKKHLSPDKNSQAENPTQQTAPIKKPEEDFELKDKQLSADIETLLFQTKSTVVGMAAVTTKEDVPVKALPIKERGKRIFKSRNRSRVEDQLNFDASNVTTDATSTTSVSSSNEALTEEAILLNNVPGLQNTDQKEEQSTELNIENQEKFLASDANDKIDSNNENLKILEENHLSIEEVVDINLELNTNSEEARSKVEIDKKRKANKLPSKKIAAKILNKMSDKEERITKRSSDFNSETENERKKQEQAIEILSQDEMQKEIEIEPTILCVSNVDAESEKEKEIKVESSLSNVKDIGSEVNKGRETEEIEPSTFCVSDIDSQNDIERVMEVVLTPLHMSNVESPTDKEKEEEESKVVTQFHDEVIPVVKHAPVEIFREESIPAADSMEVNEVDNEKDSRDIENMQAINVGNRDTANSLDAVANEERDKNLVYPLQVNTNELEIDSSSHFTSPTDENSSIGISEAGAEFGSPTSMLDDERLPIVASNLMTGIERLSQNTALEEVEAGESVSSNREQTVMDSAIYAKEVNTEKSAETIESNNPEHSNQNTDLMTDKLTKTKIDEETKIPSHEKLSSSGHELEEEIKSVKTNKKVKKRKKANSSNTNNLNTDGLHSKIKKHEDIDVHKNEKEENKEEKQQEVQKNEEEKEENIEEEEIETHKQSVENLTLQVTETEDIKPFVEDKEPIKSEKTEDLENKSKINLKMRVSKEKAKKEQNTVIISNEGTIDSAAEDKIENQIKTTDSFQLDKITDVRDYNKLSAKNAPSTYNNLHKTEKTDTNNEEQILADFETVSNQMHSEMLKKDIMNDSEMLTNDSEISDTGKTPEIEKSLEIEKSQETNNLAVKTENLLENKNEGYVEAKENMQAQVVSETKNRAETSIIQEQETRDNDKIQRENIKEVVTRKRRSHIKITPRKRDAETPTPIVTENAKDESKNLESVAKTRKKSNEIESKIINSNTVSQDSTFADTLFDEDTSIPKTELKTNEQNDAEEVSEPITTKRCSSPPRRISNENDKSEQKTPADEEENQMPSQFTVSRISTTDEKDDQRLPSPTITLIAHANEEEHQLPSPSISSRLLTPNNIESDIQSSPVVPAMPAEKVRIEVDVANPLSSQIANILATSSGQQIKPLNNTKLTMPIPSSVIPLKRKKSIEDDIPSFIIERPCATSGVATVESPSEKEAIAHVQSKCPQLKITRKEKIIESETLPPTSPVKIAQSLRSPTQMFILNPAVKHQQLINVEGGNTSALFDIGNMPILLSNEQLITAPSVEGVHIVLTPTVTTTPHIIESVATDTSSNQLLTSSTLATNQNPILMHVVPTNETKSLNDTPKILQQQIFQVAHQQVLTSESTTQQEHLLQQEIHDANFADADNQKKLKINPEALTSHQIQMQKQQPQNIASQTANKQIGVDSRGNKYVIIKTAQPPADLLSQPPPLQRLQQHNIQTKSQNAAGAAATGLTNIDSVVEAEASVQAVVENQEQQLLQQPKKLSPAAAATGGRKQAGNIITLPSSSAVKQQQQKFTESIEGAAEQLNSKSHSNNKRTIKLPIQQEIGSNKKSLALKDKKSGSKFGGSGNRRHSTAESSLPTKIAKTSANNKFTGDVLAPQKQHRQSSQPPPLHHLHNRKQRKLQPKPLPQQNSNNITESNDLLKAISQQQQHQLPSTSLTLNQQQQHSAQSTNVSEDQLMQIQSEDQIDGTSKILAVPTQPIPGYNETFLLCTLVNNNYKPIDNVPLYLDHDLNQLVPVPLEAFDGQPHLIVNHPPPDDIVNQMQMPLTSSQQQRQNQQLQLQSSNPLSAISNSPSCSLKTVEADSSTQMICLQTAVVGNDNGSITEVVPSILEPITHTSAVVNDDSDEAQMGVYAPPECNPDLPTDNAVILNIEGQQIILDAATFAHLLANPDANTQLITDDGTEFVLTREVLAALEAQQETQEEAAAEQHQRLQQHLHQTHQIPEAGPTDILAVALAGSDLYGNEVLEIETSQGLQLVGADGIVFQPALTHQHLTPPITAQTSETNALLNQTPIMSTLENPSTSGKHKSADNTTANLFAAAVSAADLTSTCRPNLEDSLAVIGVTTSSSSVPTSLELPITVTNPAIAPKSTMAGPTAPVGLASTSSVVVTESVQFQCLPHRTGGMMAGETRIYNDPGS